MRALRVLAWAGLLSAWACASAPPPTVVAVSPRYPQYVQPAVPAALASTTAASTYDLAWRSFQTGDLPTAERAFSTSIGLSPGFFPAETGWGLLELARGEADRAVPHFDRALQVARDYVPALVGRGQALAALGREGEAVAAFEAALRADPSLTDLRRRIDVLRFRGAERDLVAARQAARDGRLDEAVRAYEAAVGNSLDSAFLYRELAGVVRQKGDPDRALAYLRRATTLDPADAAAFGMMGEIYEAREELDEALKAYSSAIALEPGSVFESRRDNVRARAAMARLPDEYRTLAAATQISRAHLAALIGIRLAPLLTGSRTGDAALVTDTRGTWAEPWIAMVVGAGVMDPFDNHTFQPRAIVRRADLAQAVNALLQRIAVITPGAARPWENARLQFVDLAPAHLAYAAASAAVASGVLNSTPTAAFQPTRSVSGAEAIEAAGRIESLARLPASRDNRAR